MAIHKFSLNETESIKDYYDTYGYVVVRNLLSSAKIDRLLDCLEIKKYSPFFVFNSQDTHSVIGPRLNQHGFLENSILNPSRLKLALRFSHLTEACLVDKEASSLLSLISGDSKHIMMQNMLFDMSTGTIEHQDHYYLDSQPPGQMIAAWYSLEDIHEDSGCFFVLPSSHKGRVISRQSTNFSDHDEYRQKILELIETSDYEYQSFPLNKGDVLFWHPYTIHGAYENRDPRFSRKSLTAHFYPASLASYYATKVPNLRQSQNPSAGLFHSKNGL
jgi:phytanoyl-CoA hydroxylase